VVVGAITPHWTRVRGPEVPLRRSHWLSSPPLDVAGTLQWWMVVLDHQIFRVHLEPFIVRMVYSHADKPNTRLIREIRALYAVWVEIVELLSQVRALF